MTLPEEGSNKSEILLNHAFTGEGNSVINSHIFMFEIVNLYFQLNSVNNQLLTETVTNDFWRGTSEYCFKLK